MFPQAVGDFVCVLVILWIFVLCLIRLVKRSELDQLFEDLGNHHDWRKYDNSRLMYHCVNFWKGYNTSEYFLQVIHLYPMSCEVYILYGAGRLIGTGVRHYLLDGGSEVEVWFEGNVRIISLFRTVQNRLAESQAA